MSFHEKAQGSEAVTHCGAPHRKDSWAFQKELYNGAAKGATVYGRTHDAQTVLYDQGYAATLALHGLERTRYNPRNVRQDRMSRSWQLFRTATEEEAGNTAAENCCLVSDIPPCTNYSGGIFTDHMLQAIGGRIRSAFIVLNPTLQPKLSAIADEMEIVTVPKLAEQYHPPAPASERWQSEQKIEEHVRTELLPSLLQFAERRNVRSFWVLLEGQTMIRLAYQLLGATDLPVFVQVMDPPENWFTAHYIDEKSKADLYEQYETVLRSATGCATASWAMAEAYTQQFRARCVPVVPSLPAAAAKPREAVSNARSGAFRIGFAGQLYAADEWNTLLRVLDSLNWWYGSTPVEVHAYTTSPMDVTPVREGRLLRHPWVNSTDELIQTLSACDLLYAPYRFGESFAEEARLCFPSKLTTYFATGRPTLLHGPAYASPVRFAKQWKAAFVCDSPGDAPLLSVLQTALADMDQYREFSDRGRDVFDRCLTYDTLGRAMRYVLTSGEGRPRTGTKAPTPVATQHVS